MANSNLLPIYKELFGEDFNYYEFDVRMKMQKAVYLLHDMGIPLGDYGFRWYRHGPYCQELQDDLYEEFKNETEAAELSEDYRAEIAHLRSIIHSDKRGDYSIAQWLECLGSMHYLQKRTRRSKSSMDEVMEQLLERKPHLNCVEANTAAYGLLKELYAG